MQLGLEVRSRGAHAHSDDVVDEVHHAGEDEHHGGGCIPPRRTVTAFASAAMSQLFLYFVAGPHPRHLCLRRRRGSALFATTVRLVKAAVKVIPLRAIAGAPPDGRRARR
jgi:hypothetical protein